MSTVSKIDGLASGPQGSEQVFEQRGRFIRMFASATMVKGDVVAIDTAVSTFGLGNSVQPANSGDATIIFAIGVCADSDPNNVGPDASGVAHAIAVGEEVLIQVGGLCTYCKVDVSESAPGGALVSGSGVGVADVFDASSLSPPFAINIAESAGPNDDRAASTVLLLNVANY
tara:strand:- start:1261 stop:1776 length:516 start_codon:yes stop_codon:yes gene_type:complete